METGKYLGRAQRAPLVVRDESGRALIIRPLADDDLADELIVSNPRFRASVRRARRNRAAGRGIPLKDLRAKL